MWKDGQGFGWCYSRRCSYGGWACWFVAVGATVFVVVGVDKLGIQLVNNPATRNNIWTKKICCFISNSILFLHLHIHHTCAAHFLCTDLEAVFEIGDHA